MFDYTKKWSTETSGPARIRNAIELLKPQLNRRRFIWLHLLVSLFFSFCCGDKGNTSEHIHEQPHNHFGDDTNLHLFSTTVRTKLNYKRLKDLEEIILLRQTKKKTKRKRWAKFHCSMPYAPHQWRKTKQKTKFRLERFHFRLSPFFFCLPTGF